MLNAWYAFCLQAGFSLILLYNNCYPSLSSEGPLAQTCLKNTDMLLLTCSHLRYYYLGLELSETVAYFTSLIHLRFSPFQFSSFSLKQEMLTQPLRVENQKKIEPHSGIVLYCLCFSVVIYLVKCIIFIQLKTWFLFTQSQISGCTPCKHHYYDHIS